MQSAFRSELTGIVAVMTEINYISKHNNISSLIKIGCDSLTVVNLLNNLRTPVSTAANHFDLLQCIQHIQQDSSMAFSYYWIKSHQDSTHTLADLSRDKYLNARVDSMAQSFNRETQMIPDRCHL